MTIGDLQPLRQYCQAVLGEDLRTIIHYWVEGHEPVYTRGDVIEELEVDEEARGMFRHPLMNLQKAVWYLSRINPVLEAPGTQVYSYGEISIIQFPFNPDEGIIISLDLEGQPGEEFIAECESMIDEAQ